MATIFNNGEWNTSSISFNLPINIINLIKCTFIPTNTTKEDKMIWGLAQNDIFTTKSAYTFLSNETDSLKSGDGENFRWIWNLRVPNKIKTFIWLLSHDRLLTWAFLNRIGVNCNPACYFCSFIPETSTHIFFDYPNAKLFWHDLTSKAQMTANREIQFLQSNVGPRHGTN